MPETSIDPFALREHYQPLRVVDVADALDGMGYFNVGLVHHEVRPLWSPMRFWGVALTLRCVPSNVPMWKLPTTQEIVDAHGHWFRRFPPAKFENLIKPGHVIVTDTGGAAEVGFWGSNNALACVAAGAVGIVTDGYCRDTGEVIAQKTPVCCRRRGRTIIPGRIMAVEAQTTIACGGAQVRPGDLVGCDDDGLIIVPIEAAKEAAVHARDILLADMKGRRKLYERLGMAYDESVDFEKVEQYYHDLDARP